MANIRFLIDVNAPNAARTFDALGARVAELDKRMQKTRELSIGDRDAMAKVAQTQLAVDRLRDRVTKPIDMTIRGAAKAEAQLLAMEATADRLNEKLSAPAPAGPGLLSRAGGAAKGIGTVATRVGATAGIGAAAIGIGATGIAAAAPLAGVMAGVGALGVLAVPALSKVTTALGKTGKAGRQAWAALTPPQKTIATAIKGVEGTFDHLAAKVTPVVIGVIKQGARLARDFLPSLKPLAVAGGKIASSLIGPLDKLVKSSTFSQFISSLGKFGKQAAAVVGPAMAGLLAVLMKLFTQTMPSGVKILGALLPAFVQLLSGLSPVIVAAAKLTGGFLAWLNTRHLLIPFLAAAAAGVLLLTTVMDSNPFFLVATAITVLIGALTDLWKGSATFRNVVKGIGSAALGMGIVVVTAAQTITDAFMAMVGHILAGAARAFGWVPGIGPKLKAAAKGFKGMQSSVDSAFSGMISKMRGWQFELSASQRLSASVAKKIGGDFGAQARAANTAKSALAKYTTAIKANGENSNAARSARNRLVSDLTDAGVKSSTARKDVAAYSAAVSKNGADSNAARSARSRLVSDILSASRNSSQGKKDLAAYTSAVAKNGTSSNAARSARTKLITDLTKTGLNAKTAKGLVNALTTAVKRIPKGWSASIKVSASGKWSISGVSAQVLKAFGGGSAANIRSLASQDARQAMGGAAGGLVPGYAPGRDTYPAMLSPGEVVVVPEAARAVGVGNLLGLNRRYAGGRTSRGLRFAGGGYVGNPAMVGGWADSQDQATVAAAVNATGRAFAAAFSAAFAGGGGGGGISGAGVANSSAYAALKSAAAKMGWTGAMWNALNNVEMREAGYRLNARNPTSGAYGLAQGISGPGWYYQYGGNPYTAAGQAVAMVNYVHQRYGNPMAAWAHEQAFNWYGKGLQPRIFRTPTLIGVGEGTRAERVSVEPLGSSYGGGDGAASGGLYIGEVNINHVPGYSTPKDVQNALEIVTRQARLARR